MGPRRCTIQLLAATLLFFSAAPALGDADELSVGLTALGALFAPYYPDSPQQPDAQVAGGLELSASYATRDWFALELRTGFQGGPNDRYINAVGPVTDVVAQTRLARVTAGVTLRLGTRWIPTVGLAGGYQLRWFANARVVPTGFDVANNDPIDPPVRHELLLTPSVGLDHRFGRHLVAGGFVRAALVPFSSESHRAVELGVGLSYYFYP